MSDIHITPELLEAVERGDLPARVLTEIGWKHLLHLCPTCRGGLRTWQRRRSNSAADYDAAFRVLPLLLERHAKETGTKQRKAEKDLRELLKSPHEVQLAKVEGSHTRFRGIMLAHMLVAEAKKRLPQDPLGVYELAAVAEAVLLRTPYSLGYFDALTRVMAYKANALRAQGNLLEADERLCGARSMLRNENVTDTIVYAEVDWFEGVLRKDQRRFSEAEELLIRAASLFRIAGEPLEAVRPLLTLGLLYGDHEQFSKAVEITKSVLEAISAESDPLLYCFAWHNLTLFLTEAGRYEEAAALLGDHRDLYEACADDHTQARLAWIEGKVALGLGHLREAERVFMRLRNMFSGRGNDYDAAMVSMDLALVYVREGRTAESKKLAEETFTILEAQGVHQDKLTAFMRSFRKR